LSKPSWSVKELQSRPENTEHTTVTPKELHHLLRLSALPLPTSVEEEKKMIHTLESQLHFVRAIQTVDTSGVEPLQSIRDETAQAQEDNEIGLGTLKDELDREHQGGFARRITRRRDTTDTTDVQTGNPLGQAPKKYGRYIVVNTKTA
jgi:Asp-tRNA(Asn)/Glu-tRNA(Gln) amidotransferase C subunit